MCMCTCVCVLSHVQLFTTPRTEACTRRLCPRDAPGKNAGVGFHFLLQRIFLSQGLNPYLLPVLPALADGFLFFITWANWEALIEDWHRTKCWRKVEFTLCLTVELKYPFSPALKAPGPQAFRLGLESTPLSLILRPSNSLAFLDLRLADRRAWDIQPP